jgi:hypothetical protein
LLMQLMDSCITTDTNGEDYSWCRLKSKAHNLFWLGL